MSTVVVQNDQGLGNTALNQYNSKLSQEKITTHSISETTLIYIIITLWQGNSQTSFNHIPPV